MTVMDAQAVMALIPNRYPIFYIDRVCALEPGVRITAEKYLSASEQHVAAYLPQELSVTPTLIIEMLAQAASVLILKSPQFAGMTAYLASVANCEFHAAVPAGSVLTLQVEMGKVRRNMGIVNTQCTVGKMLVAETELHFIVSPNKSEGGVN